MAFVRKRVRNGTTRYQVTYRDASGRRRAAGSFERKVDANREKARLEADQASGRWVDPDGGKTTVAEWSREWLAAKQVKRTTATSYRSLLDSRVLPPLGDMPLGKLRRMHVEQWVADMVADGISASRIRQAHRVLSMMLDAAVDHDVLVRNVAKRVEMPRQRRTERPFLDAHQVAALADAMAPEYHALPYVMAYAGLRYGEAAALRRGRCDLLRRRLVIAENATNVRDPNGGQRLVFESTKTDSVATVALPRFVVDLLAHHLAEFVDDNPDALVFTSPTGAPLHYQNFRRRDWNPAAAGAGLDGVTPHALRHSCGAMLIAEGADPKRVQQQMRHAQIAMTFDVYGHLFDGALDDVMDALDGRHRAQTADQMLTKPVSDVVPLRPNSREYSR